jgi:hydrogenase expression/formation protein HypE
MTLAVDAIPILPITQTICRIFGLNPLGLISSGALLLTIPPDRWPALKSEMQSQGIKAQEIGIVQEGNGIQAFVEGKPTPFTPSETDELTKVR